MIIHRYSSKVCEMRPGLFRECDSLVRNMHGRLEILSVSVHAEDDTSMNHYNEHNDMALQTNKPLLPAKTETYPVIELSWKFRSKRLVHVRTRSKKRWRMKWNQVQYLQHVCWGG